MSTPSIVLWGVSASPYVRKVQIALEEKQLTYEHKQILPTILLKATGQSVPQEFIKVSPLGKIPALQVDNYCVADSTVICAYLDKKFSTGQKLYPESPEDYAKTRWFENYANTNFSDIAYKKIFLEAVVKPKILGITANQEMIEQAKLQELPICLDYLESELDKFNWLGSDDFTMADVAILSHLISLEQAGFYLDQLRWKKLYHYKEKALARDSFKKIVLRS